MKYHEKATLYYCITYYQVYIAIIKQLQNNYEADIIISDVIPGFIDLKDKIGDCIFRKVILLEEKDFVKSARDQFHAERDKMGKAQKILLSKIKWIQTQNAIIAYAKSRITFDLEEYGDIYVFGQGRSFAPLLFSIRKKYILVEDSIDYYRKYVNSYVDLNRMDHPRKFYLINRFLDFLGIYYYMGGYSHSEKLIEVNSGEDLVFSRCAAKKVTVVPRKNMLEKLSNEYKKMIFNIFMGKTVLWVDKGKKTALILTNPFLFDGLVESSDDLVLLYKRIIEKMCRDYAIFIKPHPRDFVEYSEYRDLLGDFTLIDRNLPSEIFNFNKDIRFDLAVAVSSTAIQQANYATEKINLGMEWFDAEMKIISEGR
jgi:hypothetical protein